MSSESNSSSSDTDEEGKYSFSPEDIIKKTHVIKTRSGRVSKPVKKYKAEDRKTKKKKTNMADQAGANVNIQELAQLLNNNRSSTFIASDVLPTYRGHRRPCDPEFDDANTFQTHINLLQSHIAGLTNVTEQVRKTLLVKSADTKIGDFHEVVNSLVNEDVGKNQTFAELVVTLGDLYAPKEGKNIHAKLKDISTTVLTEEGLMRQIIPLLTKIHNVAKHIVEDPTINIISKFPTKMLVETDAHFLERQQSYVKDIITNSVFMAIAGPQLSGKIQNKVLDTEFKTTETLVSQFVKVVRELPTDNKTVNSTKARVFVAETEDTQEEVVKEDFQEENELYYGVVHRGQHNNNYRRGMYNTRKNFNTRGFGNNRGAQQQPQFQPQFQQPVQQQYNQNRGRGRINTRGNTNTQCYNCGKYGHYRRECRAPSNYKQIEYNTNAKDKYEESQDFRKRV